MEFFTPSFSTEYFSPIHLYESTISSLNITAFRFFKKKKNVENAHVAFFLYTREKWQGSTLSMAMIEVRFVNRRRNEIFFNIVIHDKEKPSFLHSILKKTVQHWYFKIMKSCFINISIRNKNKIKIKHNRKKNLHF